MAGNMRVDQLCERFGTMFEDDNPHFFADSDDPVLKNVENRVTHIPTKSANGPFGMKVPTWLDGPVMKLLLLAMIAFSAIGTWNRAYGEVQTVYIVGDSTADDLFNRSIDETSPTDPVMYFLYEYRLQEEDRLDYTPSQPDYAIASFGEPTIPSYGGVKDFSPNWRMFYTQNLELAISEFDECTPVVIVGTPNYVADGNNGDFELLRKLQQKVAREHVNVGWIASDHTENLTVKYIKDLMIKGPLCK